VLIGLRHIENTFYFKTRWMTFTDFSSIEINEFFTSVLHPFCDESRIIPNTSALDKMKNTAPTDFTEVEYTIKRVDPP
jgi:hypothetical protein